MVNSRSRSSASGQVEERVDAVLAFGAADLRDGHALEALQFRRADFVQRDAFPVAEGHRILQLFAELVAEGRVAVDRLLRLLRFVREYALPRRKRGKRKRAVHVDLAGERQRRGLRPRALGDHRRRTSQGVAHGLRNIVAIEQRDEGHRTAAFVEQEVEHLALFFLEHGDLPGQRDFDRALVLFPEHVRVRLQFGAAGVAAGQRPPAEAEMLVEDRARESEGAGIHRAGEQSPIFAVSSAVAARSIDASPMT